MGELDTLPKNLIAMYEKYGGKKHGECSHFDNGTCLVLPRAFKGKKLDPKWPACPHFKAKTDLTI